MSPANYINYVLWHNRFAARVQVLVPVALSPYARHGASWVLAPTTKLLKVLFNILNVIMSKHSVAILAFGLALACSLLACAAGKCIEQARTLAYKQSCS